jgi:PAS domain S-box-containing protein
MNSSLRILHLEDDAADAGLVQDTLAMDGLACDVTRVETESGFCAALRQGGSDLILADYALPSFDGVSALKIIRRQWPDLPFIFVSGAMGEEVAIDALKIGATDYVLKTRLSRLGPAVRRALREATERAELRRSEDALLRSERELRQVIETIPAMVWSALPDASNVLMNSRWAQYTGSSAAGMGWQAAVHPDDLNRHMDAFRASSVAGLPLEDEVRFRRADGQYRWFCVQGVPLRDELGKILKWYGIVTDIEDRKRAEEERERLRQLEADLAHLNRVSTMGELVASLSHELKQPIGAAIMDANTCLRWLRRDQPDVEKAGEATMRIIKSATRAADVIDRLRSFYKKGAPAERELVDVNELVREMLVLLRSEANRHSIPVETDLAAELPEITADRVQLQQVFMNLMINGIEAMKETGGKLTITSQLNEDRQLVISVGDTGVGLPAEKADQIFNAFFTTKPQGSGMGLTISRRIVELHGGRLWATANCGRGATFHVNLPTARGPAAVPATGI